MELSGSLHCCDLDSAAAVMKVKKHKVADSLRKLTDKGFFGTDCPYVDQEMSMVVHDRRYHAFACLYSTTARLKWDLNRARNICIFTPAERSQTYKINITLREAITKTYSGVSFTDGKAQVSVAGGKSVKIDGLPVGIAWTATEEPYPLFDTTINGQSVESAGGSVKKAGETVTFTNTRKLGDLKVSKTVSSHTPGDMTRSFSFTVQLKGATIDANLYGIFSPFNQQR